MAAAIHTIHVLDDDFRRRASLARCAFELGYHAEVHDCPHELIGHIRDEGAILAAEGLLPQGVAGLAALLTEHGHWLPIVVSSIAPSYPAAVAAIKQGAYDYLPLPCEREQLGRAFAAVLAEARVHREQRVRHVYATTQLAKLSTREFEVLDLMAQGHSNKEIGRILAISPRTVEIHRTKALAKLGARHSLEAVRLRLEAGGLAEAVTPPQPAPTSRARTVLAA